MNQPKVQDATNATTQGLEDVGCTVCGADDHEFLHEAIEFRHAKGERFGLVKCSACQHVYTNPRPSPESIGRYYPDEYYHMEKADTAAEDQGKPHLRERLTRSAQRQHFDYPGDTPVTFFRRLITLPLAWWLRHGRRTVQAIPWAGDGELCDFGCGACGFLRMQRDRGWTCSGVDFNETVAQWATEKQGFDVAAGTWPGDGHQGRTFDVISGWHVIEHVPAPIAWVRACIEKLKPGGYLLICCPDGDSWAYRTFKSSWYGLDVPRHFSHFKKKQLAKILNEEGLVVERVRPQARPSTLRSSAKLYVEQNGSGFWGLMTKMKWPWKIIASLTGWFGCADGMVIIARKPN